MGRYASGQFVRAVQYKQSIIIIIFITRFFLENIVIPNFSTLKIIPFSATKMCFIERILHHQNTLIVIGLKGLKTTAFFPKVLVMVMICK